MRVDVTQSFLADYHKLSPAEKEMFKAASLEFSKACDAYVTSNTPSPGSLRVFPVQGAPGIFEMTWSFSGPDGRATWQWDHITVKVKDGPDVRQPSVLWRRIGLHAIFSNP